MTDYNYVLYPFITILCPKKWMATFHFHPSTRSKTKNPKTMTIMDAMIGFLVILSCYGSILPAIRPTGFLASSLVVLVTILFCFIYFCMSLCYPLSFLFLLSRFPRASLCSHFVSLQAKRYGAFVNFYCLLSFWLANANAIISQIIYLLSF